ncbi:MAG: response regulator [Spirochaetaceae bacterium]|jgi:two-component SAPR family response regulator|nr:response regulator [Spirochaetaceae bacterium]
MNIITVDDEVAALHSIERAVKEACPADELESFTSASAAMKAATEKQIDVAFLDINMREMSGMELALHLRRINQKTNIIFVTAYADFMGKALKMHASGYIMKPATADDVRDEIENLRLPPPPEEQIGQGLLKEIAHCFVQCFGSFEVFKDGVAMDFHRPKSKEIFAYLVDRRGASVNNNELMAVIWEEEDDTSSRRSQLRTLIAELIHCLRENGLEQWIVKRWNSIAVRPNLIPCDYYNFLNGDVAALNTYTGEYMMQYSWAEMTNAWISSKADN